MANDFRLSENLLSKITIYSKYSKYIPESNRREDWDEIIDRTMLMHCKKYPKLEEEIIHIFERYVKSKLVLPSMRSLQFAGKPIELFPNRIMNCAATPIDDTKVFRELMFLLMGGTGVGYSVQHSHIKKLPTIKKPIGKLRYVVQDSIIGWAEAVDILMNAYFYGSRAPEFDFQDIRPRGTPLKTSGGRAPGPEELQKSLEAIRTILDKVKYGGMLTSIQIHDICCHIAAAVLSGGIRRSAMICLFDFDDESMLNAKSGNWLEENPQRQYANNSAMTLRYKIRKKDVLAYITRIKDTGFGEPGLYFANDYNSLCNPCAEASVCNNFCNLTTFNMSVVESNDDLYEFAAAAAFIGTLQAGYTDFVYLRPIWKEKTEEEALLGVSCTGVARKDLFDFDFIGAAKQVKEVNKQVAKEIGINPAYRGTVNKPEGTSSAVLNTLSGIHAGEAKYGIRRTRYMYDEPIIEYLEKIMPDLIETDVYDSNKKVLSLPFHLSDNAILKENETAIELLERVKFMSLNWVKPGHRKGHNGHSVSATISVRDNEWDEVAEWMWKNRNDYNGLSILPYDGGKYKQAPFEGIKEEEYKKLVEKIPENIDLKNVIEQKDNTNRQGEISCSNGACEIL
jgi:ribonucleoside-diphosphate reductase alpha chain